MRLPWLVSGALLVLTKVTSASPTSSTTNDTANGRCINPIVRKEWRTLSKTQQLEYISAVKCLQSKPGQTQELYSGVRSRFDDYQGLHIYQAIIQQIHMVGRFLPWHRIYLALFEADLKSSCGYQGALPYWDWSLDVTTETSFLESPIFDPVYGFGGNGAFIEDVSNITQTSGVPVPGRSGGGCLTTGPWANFTVNMGPGESTEYTPSCLRRDIAPEFASRTCAKAMVDWTLEEDDFALFDMRIEAMNLTLDGTTTHACGHWGVGGQVGQMADVWSSPGDPIFYQHHANIDYLWYKWQMLDWPARKTAIGGPDVAGAYPFLFFGDIPYNNVTLDYELDLGMIGGNITVRDVMDTTAGKLCYTYE